VDAARGAGAEDLMDAEFYYNTRTGTVEEGRVSDWSVLMGPYPTREAAAAALDTARRRTQAWEDEERARQAEDDS